MINEKTVLTALQDAQAQLRFVANPEGRGQIAAEFLRLTASNADLTRQLAEAREDSARLDWMAKNECKLMCHREKWGGDGWSLWWTAVSRSTGKALGHPLGSPRAAIDQARKVTGADRG